MSWVSTLLAKKKCAPPAAEKLRVARKPTVWLMRTCEHCLEKFSFQAYRKGRARFCSRPCQRHYKRTRKFQMKCACGEIFRSASKNAVYCGRTCLEKARVERMLERLGCEVVTIRPGMKLKDVKTKLLAVTLDATKGDPVKAAEMMGVHVRTIYNLTAPYRKAA